MQTISDSDRAVDELGDAVVELVRIWRCVGRRVADHQSPSPLGILEMARLLGDGEHRLSEIAELRGVDQSVISRQIGELQRQDLVSRRPDPSDRRASLVRLTPQGHALLESVRKLRQGWLRDALTRSRVDDVRTTARLIAALAEELDHHATTGLGALVAPVKDASLS